MIDADPPERSAPRRVSVRELFGSTDRYVVPIYQRNYAWGETQIHQLVDDIVDAAESGAEYFLGNLVVGAREDGRFEVIDGQQRLTTLFLLAAFLDERHGDTLEPLVYASRLNASATLARIGRAWRDVVASATDDDLDENILAACRSIEQHGRSKQLRAHASYVRENVVLVRVTVPKDTDRNRYFEVMNSRGAQLEPADIVKARLMRLLECPRERAVFARVWAACADMDHYVQMTLTPKDTGLRSQLFGEDWSWLKPRGFEELAELLQAEDAEAPPPPTLDEALEHYDRVDAGRPLEPDETTERFEATIRFPTLLLHTLRVFLQESDDDERRLDDKALVKGFSGLERPEQVRDFCHTLLECRFLLDNFVLKRKGPDNEDQQWSLERLVRRKTQGRDVPGYEDAFPDSQRPICLLQQALRITYTSPRTMHWITELLLRLRALERPPSGREVLATLEAYAREKVRPSFDGSVFRPQGFDVPRIVFTWLDYLLAKDSSADFEFTFRNSIEHFFPQNPPAEMTGRRVDPESIHRFGNLCLVSVRDNSRFGNAAPETKVTRHAGTLDQSPKLRKMADRAGRWDDDAVREHEEEMLAPLRDSLGLTRDVG